MNKNSHNYIHNDNIIQHQGELVRLIKEQGYLEPLCNGCQIENYEVQGKEIQNLKDSLIQLTKQAEIQQEKVHLDMLHVDSIKAKLGNLAKGFVFIANKYSKISQNIMNFEKGVSYNCDLPNYGYGKLQQLVESINQDKSESNYKQVMKEQEIIKANLINNNTFLVDEDAVEKRKAYLDDVEDYSDKLKLQLEICSFIADKIFCSLDYKTFAVQFKELQKYVLQSDKVKSKTNDLSLEEQLEQVKDQLSKSELQKLSMERLYINLKQYLHKNNFIIPETVLQVDYISSPQRGRSSPEKQVKQEAQKDTPSQRDAAIIENSKEIIKKLMENNKQLNELAKRVIEENKLLKEENNQYIDKINSISPIVNLPSTHTPSLNTVKNLRYSMTTQVSEFQQVSSFSPNPKIMKSPPSSKQKVVFESIRNSYSKSPMKKSYALENTIQSIDIENSQTLTMMKAKDSELSDLNKQKEELQQEIQKLKQKIERQQTQINEFEENIQSQKSVYEKQIIALKNAQQGEILHLQQEIQIKQNKYNILWQEQQQLILQAQIQEETIINLKQVIEKQNFEMKSLLFQQQNQFNQERGNILNDHNFNQVEKHKFEEQQIQEMQKMKYIQQRQQSQESIDDGHFQIINLKLKSNLDQDQNNPLQDQSDFTNNSKIKINTLIDHKSKMQKKVQPNNRFQDKVSAQKIINQKILPQTSLEDQMQNNSDIHMSYEGNQQSIVELETAAQKSQVSPQKLDKMTKRNKEQIIIQDEQFLINYDENQQI